MVRAGDFGGSNPSLATKSSIMGWKSYFNTLGLSRSQAAVMSQRNENQEDQILTFMKKHPRKLYGGSDLARKFKMMPITSIRRSLTQLHHKKKIVRSWETQISPLGHPEYLYRAAP